MDAADRAFGAETIFPYLTENTPTKHTAFQYVQTLGQRANRLRTLRQSGSSYEDDPRPAT